jgi:hypothetical protein
VVQSNFDEIATELTIDPAGAACVREVIEYSNFFASICFRDFAEYALKPRTSAIQFHQRPAPSHVFAADEKLIPSRI